MAVISYNLGWRATVISWIIIGALGMIFTAISLKSYTKFITEEKD
jgi:hypothetical protein